MELLEVVVEAKETLAVDHPSRLASQHELAGAYQANGRSKRQSSCLKRLSRYVQKCSQKTIPLDWRRSMRLLEHAKKTTEIKSANQLDQLFMRRRR